MLPLPAPHLDLVRQALHDLPRPDQLARSKLAGWLATQGFSDSPLDVDVVSLHYQSEPLGEGRAYTRQNAVITQRLNLVEALLNNWQGESAEGYRGFHYGDWAGLAPSTELHIVERLEPPGLFSNAPSYLVFNGLYRRTQPPRYAPDTRLAIRAEDFQIYIWSLHFHNDFKAQLDAYWLKRQAHYQRAIRIAFIAACNQQILHGSLTPASRLMIWRAAGLVPREDVRSSMLNIYGYRSSSIVLLSHVSAPEVVLYIPGNAAPFHEFANLAALQQWIAAQCRDEASRLALRSHFNRADWPDGLDFSGLDTALKGLGLYPRPHRLSVNHPGFTTSGVWTPGEVINYRPDKYSPPIQGELFEALTLLQKQRTYADADSQITSNHDINKAHWAGYLGLVTTLLAPLVIVLPELTPLLVVGGLAQFGLGLDAAINGKSLRQKEQSVSTQVFGLLNALPAGGNLFGRPAEVFRFTRPGFFSSQRLGELLGAPIGAAPQVQAVELEPAELAFREQAPISSGAISALVTRIDENLGHRFAAWIQHNGQVTSEWVHYEFASDSFIRLRDIKLINPPRWIIEAEGDPALVLSTQRRIASEAQRAATLHALGINLQLPVDYAPYAQLKRTPIPQIVSSVWLGDKVLEGEFLQALVHNAHALRGSPYRFQIFLSRQNRPAYLTNLRLLREHRVDQALLMPLEDQDFFQAFSQSPYFPQYQAALDGNGGVARNFSSACDILRYRLLSHYGGLYLDADDRLLLATGTRTELPLQRLELKTTADGLLLSPPVSNDQMGMYIKYNSSMIGSHPANPTLDAISERILERFHMAPDFYLSRPDPLLQPLPFQAYARRLSLISGPGVLNDVIDDQLPWLKQLRELCNLLVSPIYDIHATLNINLFNAVLREHVPLDQVAQMGQAHSWAAPGSR